jgi:hypothetical protein
VFKVCSDRDIGPKFKEIEVSISQHGYPSPKNSSSKGGFRVETYFEGQPLIYS